MKGAKQVVSCPANQQPLASYLFARKHWSPTKEFAETEQNILDQQASQVRSRISAILWVCPPHGRPNPEVSLTLPEIRSTICLHGFFHGGRGEITSYKTNKKNKGRARIFQQKKSNVGNVGGAKKKKKQKIFRNPAFPFGLSRQPCQFKKIIIIIKNKTEEAKWRCC